MDENTTVKLPVQANGKLREFTSPERLITFIEEELEAWDFLVNAESSNRNIPEYKILNKLNRYLLSIITNSLSSIATNWNEPQQDKIKAFIDLQREFDFPFSRTTKGKAILGLQEDNITKAVVLGLSCMPSSNFSVTPFKEYISLWVNLNGTAGHLEVDYKLMPVIIFKAQQIINNINQSKNFEKEKILNNITDAYQKLEEENVKLEKRLDAVATQAEAEHSEMRERLSNFIKRRLKLYKKNYNSAQEQVRATQEQVKAAKNTYENEVELHASVKYWDDKRVSHFKGRIIWGISLGGSLWGTYWAFREVLINPEITEKLVLNSAEVAKIAEPVLLAGIINPITVSLGLVVLSIGSYIIKLNSQQFRTHQHLMLEAIERHTMLKTYLALMSENKLKDTEDRKIALDVLFRPASTGIIQEQGNVMPSDSIIKIIRSKTST